MVSATFIFPIFPIAIGVGTGSHYLFLRMGVIAIFSIFTSRGEKSSDSMGVGKISRKVITLLFAHFSLHLASHHLFEITPARDRKGEREGEGRASYLLHFGREMGDGRRERREGRDAKAESICSFPLGAH